MVNIVKLKVYCLLLAGVIYCLASNWEELFKEGEKFFEAKNYNRAISIFDEIYKKEERDELSAKSALRLGQCYLVFKDYKKARQFFKEAQKWGGDIGEQAQIGTALTYMNEGENDIAIDILSQVISLSMTDENLAYAYYDRALCYKAKNWIRKAIEDLKEAKKRAKDNATLLKAVNDELSKCQSLYEELQSKENSYLQNMQMEYLGGDLDACANLLRELARFCEEWGEVDKAIDYEKQALDYSTSEEFKAGSLMNIGWRYCKEGKLEEAGQAFQKVAEDYPQSSYAPEALLRAGDMYSSAGKKEEARKCYQALIQKYPENERVSSALLNLAWLSVRMNEGWQMESLLEELLKRTPESEIRYFVLGYLNERRGKYQEAIDAYQRCANYGGAYRILALTGMGASYYNLGKKGDVKSLQKSFEIFASLLRDKETPQPTRSEAITLGVASSLDFRMDRAIGYRQLWSIRDVLLSEELETALYRDELKAPLYLALSRCYIQVGDKEKAIELWTEPIRTTNRSTIYKLFPILREKFAPILRKSSLRPRGEEALEDCKFSSIDSFFFPKGREYPDIWLIYGTSNSDAQAELYEKFLQNLLSADIFLTFPKDKIKVVKDKDVKEEDLSKANLLLVGSAADNALIERVKNSLPIKLGDKFVEIRERKYEGSDICVIMDVPNPFNKDKAVLVIWSTDPLAFSKPFGIPLDVPINYLIFRGDFSSLKDDAVLEGGFFFQRPDRTYEAF
ncbi:tetratricopeptide repeat protein [bacterium]|nr:tetratricopeptide repeat protein [bacterium]